MYQKQKLKNLYIKIAKLPLRKKLPIAVAFLLLSVGFIIYLQVKTVQFSYGEDTCASQLTLLPAINRMSDNSSAFTVKNEDVIKVGSLQIASLKTCFVAKQAPSTGESRISMSPFGGWLSRKTFKVAVSKPPVASVGVLSQPIPAAKHLAIKLSSPDVVFNYRIKIDGRSASCPLQDNTIYCDVASLKLVQDKEYKASLVRRFKDKEIKVLASRNIKTLKETTLVGSSVAQGQIVYDKPKAFTFTFDKNVARSDVVLSKVAGAVRTVVKTTTTIDGKIATVTIANDLDRDSDYEFTIDNLEAKDGSTLASPYKLGFKMSDGPGVASVSTGSIGLSLTQTIVLTMDQDLRTDQNIADYVSTSGIAASIYRQNNQIFISYANAPMCTDMSIKIKPGLLSANGIIQNDAWTYNVRTTCHTVLTIGYSKEGRSILAYVFGSGATTVLYTGAIHGNELSGKYLMQSWVDELELNARNIPSDRRIVVIPVLNPDGVAAVRRNNSNNVDLNRNFATSDWQTDIVSPSNQPIPGGGGASPMSEPETQVIANYTLQLMPRLTMSFHSNAGYAIANQAGDSSSLAATYSSMTGYRNMTGNSGAFSYPITGAYDDWMCEKYGLASVLIELSTSYSSEFSRNKAALWTMARS